MSVQVGVCFTCECAVNVEDTNFLHNQYFNIAFVFTKEISPVFSIYQEF